MIEQGSPEWKALRCGKVTASRIADLTAKLKSGGWGASRANYMAELIAERLTGVPAESYVNAAMAWGTAKEPDAKAAYEFHTDLTIAPASFVDHPTLAMSGASPDGLVGDDGLIEIKCPNTATHIETLLGAGVDTAYIKQMHWQMACTGRQWCDFVSFDPRMPGSMCLFIHRVKRDENLINELQIAVSVFLTELDDKIAALRALHERKAA